MQRTLIAGLAIVCVGAGGGTAWAITSATLTRTPDNRIAAHGKLAVR